MIGLLIQDNAYEQDIRELLMSFYPGETYAHEVKEGVDFYVQTRLEDGEAVIGIWEKNGKWGRTGRLDSDCPFHRKSRSLRPLCHKKRY